MEKIKYLYLLLNGMRLTNPFWFIPGGNFFNSLLFDYFLAFTFFTSLIYAVFNKRFQHQRASIGLSVSLGLALSTGLVWWEYQKNVSVRNLGPIAIIFALIIMFLVVFQSLKQTGGSWAGGGFAVAACLILFLFSGMRSPIDLEFFFSLISFAFIFGMLTLLVHVSHQRPSVTSSYTPSYSRQETSDIDGDIARIYRDRSLSGQITGAIRKLRKDTDLVKSYPNEMPDIIKQIKRLLPPEGFLTGQLAGLRKKAYRMREGHLARIKELKHLSRHTPRDKKQMISWEIKKRYQELDMDNRLARLDKAVAEFELKIRELTKRAKLAMEQYHFKEYENLLKEAEKLQEHNSRLLRKIQQAESKISDLARQIDKSLGGANTNVAK